MRLGVAVPHNIHLKNRGCNRIEMAVGASTPPIALSPPLILGFFKPLRKLPTRWGRPTVSISEKPT